MLQENWVLVSIFCLGNPITETLEERWLCAWAELRDLVSSAVGELAPGLGDFGDGGRR